MQATSTSLPISNQLQAVTEQTLLLISGTAGAGKSELIKNIIRNYGGSLKDIAVVMNDYDDLVAAREADKLAKLGIDVSKLGGCSCCSSKARLDKAISSFKSQGLKLIIIEASGVTDASVIKQDLVQSNTRVFSIAMVNCAEEKPAKTVQDHAILSSDMVILSNANDADRVEQRQRHIKQLVDRSPNVIQESPGQITSNAWSSMLSSGINTKTVAHDSDYRDQRKRLVMQSISVLCHEEGITNDTIISSIKDSSVPIARAKGIMKIGGNWCEVHWAPSMGDHINCSPTDFIPTDGKPYLTIQSTITAPLAHEFLKIGIPELPVDYFLGIYPNKTRLTTMSNTEDGTPVSSQGDTLYLSVYPLIEHLDKLPIDKIDEVDSAFEKLLNKYIDWRLDVIDVIKNENPKPDLAKRNIELAWDLCFTRERFESVLDDDRFSNINEVKPSTLLFTALSQITNFEFRENPLLDIDRANKIIEFANYGAQLEDMGVELFKAAMKNLSKIAETQTQLKEFLPYITETVLNQVYS